MHPFPVLPLRVGEKTEARASRLEGLDESLKLRDGEDVARCTETGERPVLGHNAKVQGNMNIKVHV